LPLRYSRLQEKVDLSHLRYSYQFSAFHMLIEGILMANRLMMRGLATAFFLACAPPKVEKPESANSQLITEAEVEASGAVTAFDVIQKLHANFLHDRGETSLSKSRSAPYPTVYVDGQEFGALPSLRLIPSIQISTIRLYRAWEAATTFGATNGAGVIAITTRR